MGAQLIRPVEVAGKAISRLRSLAEPGHGQSFLPKNKNHEFEFGNTSRAQSPWLFQSGVLRPRYSVELVFVPEPVKTRRRGLVAVKVAAGSATVSPARFRSE